SWPLERALSTIVAEPCGVAVLLNCAQPAEMLFTQLEQSSEGEARASARLGVPTSLYGSFEGTAGAFQRSLESQPLLILAALITVYLVLGILYESLVHPITILSTLPSAGVGALLALMATGTEVSIIAMIGVLLLIGIVKKNA